MNITSWLKCFKFLVLHTFIKSVYNGYWYLAVCVPHGKPLGGFRLTSAAEVFAAGRI